MYMKKISIVLILLISMVGSGLAQTKKTTTKPASTKSTSKKAEPTPKHSLVYGSNKPIEQIQMVEISTNYGVMVVKLYNETPLHRDNFIKLVKQGFYDS